MRRTESKLWSEGQRWTSRTFCQSRCQANRDSASRGLRVCRGLGLSSFPFLQPKPTPLQGMRREECTPTLHPPLLAPSRGARMEAPLWKITKTPGSRSLCFSSFSLPPQPFACFFLSSVRGLFAVVEYTVRSSRSLPEGCGEPGRSPW